MRNAIIAMLATTSLALGVSPASAGGWGHGPSFSQAGRFAHDTFHQVIVPVITGTINAAGAGAAHSAKNGGGEMEQAPTSPPQADEEQPPKEETSTQGTAEDKDSLLPPPIFRRDPWLEQLKNTKEMPRDPEGPTIGAAREPILPPSCGMKCPAIIDSPANDLPDPRGVPSPAPPPVMPRVMD